MKRGLRFWVLWTFAVIGVSGCAMPQYKRQGAMLGAVVGAVVGAGAGAGIGPEFNGDEEDNRGIGIGIGAAAGALIGGVVGYLLAQEEVPPPPPPAPPPPPRMAPPPSPPPPPAPREAKRITLRGINFDFDKSNIKPEFQPVLDEAAQILQENPNIRVTIEGHCDSKGTDAYNDRLSQRRADSVKRYLVSGGVSGSRLETVGYGESRPIAPNQTPGGRDNPEGRALNRRAELKVQ